MTQHLDPSTSKSKKGKKSKPKKQTTLPPEELAKRYAAAKARAITNREKTKERGKLSDEEQENLRKQDYAAKTARKAAAYEARWERSHAARMQFCLYGGLACLILTPSRLDPTIGAAACQQYAVLAVIYRSMLQRGLSALKWLAAEDTCKSFIGEAAARDTRRNLLPTTDYELPNIPHDFQALYDRAYTILSSRQVRYLQLALALWESSVLSFDEFDQVCRLRGNASLGKYEAELRSEFSYLADKLYMEEISRLPPTHEQAVELYRKTTSRYYMDAREQHPVICPSVFATFYLNQALGWHHDFIIVIGMTRVGIHQPCQSPTTESGMKLSRHSYSLGFTDTYYYRRVLPQGFEMIPHPTEADLARPCLFFDCVGTAFADSAPNSDGIFSLNASISRDTFAHIDPTWLLMSWAAGHPDRAKRADPSSAATRDNAVRDIYGGDSAVRSAKYDEHTLDVEPQDRPTETERQKHTEATPAEFLLYGRRHAAATGQVGEHYFNDITVGKDEAVPRTRSDLRFHVVHVLASVGKVEERRRAEVRRRHEGLRSGAEGEGPLGGYVFTNGKMGHSCRSREEAVGLQGSGSRMRKYLAAYPEMGGFCGVVGNLDKAERHVGEDSAVEREKRCFRCGQCCL